MKHLPVFVGSLMCLLLAACTNSGGDFPQVANPPPFDYADGEELRSGMHRLAFSLQRLDNILATEYEEGPDFEASVADNLRDIENIAKSLRSSDINSKHLFLAEDMDRFLSDVNRAQWYAAKNRYYMAGRIAGSCVSCHKASY